jgi:hypothetical protein
VVERREPHERLHMFSPCAKLVLEVW